MIVKMTKISNNRNAMRNDIAYGNPLFWPPKQGISFVLVSNGIDQQYPNRVITTSIVEDVVNFGDNDKEIYTRYSVYKLEVLNETST